MKYYFYGELCHDGKMRGVIDRYNEKESGPIEIVGPYAIMHYGKVVARANCIFTSLSECKTVAKNVFDNVEMAFSA